MCYTYFMVPNEPIRLPDVFDPNCHSRYVLDLISDKWVPLVIQLLHERTQRYSHLKRRIGGISQKMLTQTLRKLEASGLVTRTIYATVPPTVEYALTPLGKSLVEPISVVLHWSEEHADEIQAFREKQEARTSD